MLFWFSKQSVRVTTATWGFFKCPVAPVVVIHKILSYTELCYWTEFTLSNRQEKQHFHSALLVNGWRHFHSTSSSSLTLFNYFYITWPQIERINIGLYFLWMLSFKRLFVWVIKQGLPPSVTEKQIVSQGGRNICSQLKIQPAEKCVFSHDNPGQ